jgi:preprotein translocase subunit SecY
MDQFDPALHYLTIYFLSFFLSFLHIFFVIVFFSKMLKYELILTSEGKKLYRSIENYISKLIYCKSFD